MFYCKSQIGLISKHKVNNLVDLVIEIILTSISRINEPPVCALCLPTSDGCCTDTTTGSKWQLSIVSVSQRLNGETSRAD